MHTFRPVLSTLAALVLGANTLPAFQLQVCSSDDVALRPTNWNATLTFDRFDPALGVLQSIDITLSGEAEGSAAVESLDMTPTTVNTQFQATIRLNRPDTTTLVVTSPSTMFTDDLAEFDGIIDFMGDSGETHSAIVTSGMEIATLTGMADLALFTGPSGNPGTIDLPASATGTSTASGSGNLLTQFMTSASGNFLVCYNYALDCNGNGVPDSDDISQGTSHDVTPDGVPDECQPNTTSFCEGDGSANGGADCPCMNNGNPGQGCDNGTGMGAVLSATGVPSVSNDTLSLTASGLLPTTPGMFFFGNTPAAGGDGIPFGNGLRCILTGTRLAKQTGGGNYPQPGSPPLSVLLGIQAGTTNLFQFWYRNPNGPCPGLGVNTTNGLKVTWGL